ncbi:aminotransferase class IV [Veillonella ratti]|uniref:aminotransferase class IV n=1 Tax=Veillonella ratti TaxID=103892 RepID=UPI0019CF53F9|nr:aminotransferase class IV [Veillonella ratti]
MNLTFDDGYQFGLGAFETIALVNGKPIWLDAHETRLRHTLDWLGITLPDDWKSQLQAYLEQNGTGMGVVKILVSANNLSFTSRPNPYDTLPSRPGFVLALADIRRNESSPFVYHKTFNYGDSILAKRQAAKDGIDEPIFCNSRGMLAEGAVSNLFFIKKGQLYTPPVEAGLLPGIVRAYLCHRYDVIEKAITPDEINSFDECFITNSLMGIMPVRQFGSHAFPVTAQTMTETLSQNYLKDRFESFLGLDKPQK